MVLPLKNVVYDIIQAENNTTDTKLIKLLNKSGVDIGKKDMNKILLQLEMMDLVSVRWLGKNEKRIELSDSNSQKENAMW